LGSHDTTAQVHPGLLTKFLAEKFLEKPQAALLLGRATALVTASGAVSSITVCPKAGGETNVVPADVVVIAAGPWTGKLAVDLLGKQIGSKLGVDGHRAHSIVVKTKEELSAHCLFASMTMEDGSMGEPEVYARPDGTTYM
jgi:glycine/D-amino acid oxidase-like deaminating enzyme